MRVRRLDGDGDMTFGGGDRDFLRDSAEAVGQLVLSRLRLWVGEWFLDTQAGTAWAGGVLGVGTRRTIEPVVRARVRETPGVLAVPVFEFAIDADTRAASIRAEVETEFGTAVVEGVL